MKKRIELSRKKSAYSVYVYGALDVFLFPNKRLNVDLKNIEIWVSHDLNIISFRALGAQHIWIFLAMDIINIISNIFLLISMDSGWILEFSLLDWRATAAARESLKELRDARMWEHNYSKYLPKSSLVRMRERRTGPEPSKMKTCSAS